MKRLAAGCIAASLAWGPAQAADPSAICEGLAGKWRVLDDSELKDGRWVQDLSDADWRVEAIEAGKCRFMRADGKIWYDVDPTKGAYDVVDWDTGKPAPVDHYRFVTQAIDSPRSWHVVVEIPRRAESTRSTHMAMTMTGDLFTVTLLSAATLDAPHVPVGTTVHRRVAEAPAAGGK